MYCVVYDYKYRGVLHIRKDKLFVVLVEKKKLKLKKYNKKIFTNFC